MQFQEKLIQTQENDKKLHFGTDLVTLGQNSGHQLFLFSKVWLCYSLEIMVSYHHVQH